MKTDKELLILAAKAAGYEIYSWADNIVRTNRRDKMWNPLSDDGDALRLAVDLGLCISTAGKYLGGVDCSIIVGMSATESHGNDKHAATRRAIVRAAAAIGEDME